MELPRRSHKSQAAAGGGRGPITKAANTTPRTTQVAAGKRPAKEDSSTPMPAKRSCPQARPARAQSGGKAKQVTTTSKVVELSGRCGGGKNLETSLERDLESVIDGRSELEQDDGENDEGDDGSGSEGGLSDALSEGLERLLWSEDEEDAEDKGSAKSRQPEAGTLALRLVPVSDSEALLSAGQGLADALAALSCLPLPLCGLDGKWGESAGSSAEAGQEALQVSLVPLPSAPVVAYGRSRRRFEAMPIGFGTGPELLALPPPAPLTALPPLSVLMEAGRAALRATSQPLLRRVPAPTEWLYPARLYPVAAWDWDNDVDGADGPPRQGQPGFRRYAQRALERFRSCGAEARALADESGAPLQPYQLRVSFLLHPMSPLSRLLVVHATGAGKTRTVLSAADSFYRSGKATCLFFPEEAVKDNFYQELLKFPGAWRDFFCASEDVPDWRNRRHRCWTSDEIAEFPTSQVEACLGLERKVRLGEISPTFLEEWAWSHPDVPAPLAPLRAFKYTAAGGSKGGWRRNGAFDVTRMDTVFRFGFDGQNPMSNKNLVFDEVHNLLALPKWRGNYWKEPLRRLRKAVRDSQGSTLVFLTGSPVQTDVEDGHRLLRVLKGTENATVGNEGWLDMHLERSLEHFPKVFPAGVPDVPLSPELEAELILPVEMPEEMVAKYREVEAQGGDSARLRDCCNLAVHHSWALRPQKRGLVLEDAEKHAAKLHEVAKAVWALGEKALAAVSRRGGLQVLKELLRLYAPDEHVQIAVFSGNSSAVISRGAETDEMVSPSEALRRFNDPRHAEVRVLLLDTAFGREGLSAIGVGQLHLVDVPGSWAEYKQTVGRAIRFGDAKPIGLRSVRVNLWAARFADEEAGASADEELLAQLRRQGAVLHTAEQELAAFCITAQEPATGLR
ncbi:unnamed protein product [Polarella glacialis]|uniref:Helicase C-terminal domain-containing protein n=1 Tax=Polarella glacialis TaxID=89957 RepID=A0A813M2E4_POLGL|nr:unnamed protein product [Polarella glacialis]